MLLFVAFACISQTTSAQTASVQTASVQTEKLGIVQYTPLQGWKKTVSENMVGFSELNQSTGRFCIITLYGATTSNGSPEADFSSEWNSLVVKTLAGEASPKTQTQSADGWTITASATGVEAAGAKSIAFLTVVTGYGKRVIVLAVFNDQSYMVQLERFVAALEVDKTAPAPPARAPAPTPTPTPAPTPAPN
jgi:hypothetical protein